ncbi:MAG: biosynthetic-type acetolactate synthase large subunit [Firmicutes bacterium]|nr:biosynthetic-type acetolactate synthase large subunit [Bacillota bacterium]
METGARALLRCLTEEGVEVIFGYPGGAVLPLYDALYDADIRHILVRHEQAAAHAADGYARVTGRVGVCLATSGPGGTNLVTGLATALMDSVPVVAITGQVARPLLGTDAFQEADMTGVTRAVTKHNALVDDPARLPEMVREAFRVARSGRPGPVLLDIPKDVLLAECGGAGPRPRPRRADRPWWRAEPDAAQVEAAAAAIVRARRPLILAGGGVIQAGAHEALRELAELTGIPVASTLMGLGAMPGTHPLHIGLIGMHGMFAVNRAASQADLIIGLGLRFDDRVTGKVSNFAPRAQIVHLDIDPAEIGKLVPAHYPVPGDLARTLPALLEAVRRRLAREGAASQEGAARYAEWWAGIRRWERQQGWTARTPMELGGRGGQPLRPQAVIQALYRATGGEAVVCTDVGQHQMWTALLYPFHSPRQLVTSGGLGTMGFGLPAALGAQVALPEREVWLVTGDGSFQMNIQEMATAVAYDLPVRVLILNNRSLGMVRQWQELFHQARYSAVDVDAQPDYVKLAEAYGWTGFHVETAAELADALAAARAAAGPVLLNVAVAPQQNVFPMVPAGASLAETMLEAPPVPAGARRRDGEEEGT